MNIGFIGLGVMGYPMATHLQAAGHCVRVFNRTAEKAQRWARETGGRCAATPKEAAQGAKIVLVCVGNDDDVRSVLLGSHGALAGMGSEDLIIDHTTSSAELAREIAGIAALKGVDFLDAPVSGGQAGAENAALTVMVGGSEQVFAQAEPVLRCYATCTRLLGPVGSGQLAKMVNQICIAGVIQGLAEALLFSEYAGLDSAAVMEVISQGAAQSWQLDNRAQTMLAQEYEHGFAVDWMRKDLKMVLARAQTMDITLPLTELVDGYYGDLQTMGGGRWDTSSLLARLWRKQRDKEEKPI